MLNQNQIKAVWHPPCRGPWVTKHLHGAGRVTVRPSAWEAVDALNACLIAWNYQTRYADTGAYVCRQKVTGNGYSLHAYAIALDLNWQSNPYGGSRHEIPTALATAICKIRTKSGAQVWNWGGFWSGTRDWMHFEIVCAPWDLATGINWNTVPGRNTNPSPPPFIPAPQPQPQPEPQPPIPTLPTTTEDEDEMRLFKDHENRYWLLGGLYREHVGTMGEVSALQASWIPFSNMGKDSPYYNPIVSQVILDNTTEI